MILDKFQIFDPFCNNRCSIQESPGNYIVTIRDISVLPTRGHEIITKEFDEKNIIYTGKSTNLKKRIWNNHITGNASLSTLRLSLGCLLGYTLISRDKNDPYNGKVRFSPEEEKKLSSWIKENLVFYYFVNDKQSELELSLIKEFNPPLNLDECKSLVNWEFRSAIKYYRSMPPVMFARS